MISNKLIQEEIDFYQSLSDKYNRQIKTLPNGSINFKFDHGKWRPHHYINGQSLYLKQTDTALINDLVTKKFIKECLYGISNNIDALDSIGGKLIDFESLNINNIGNEFEASKKRGFTLSDFWDRPEYKPSETNPYKPEAKVHMSPSGVLLRSKSELSIATFLELKEVEYIYEEALILNGRIIYPDFKVRNKTTGKRIIWDHLGMMDDDDYAHKNEHRILEYLRNGYRLGDNLILTYDEHGTLNMNTLNKIYETMLK